MTTNDVLSIQQSYQIVGRSPLLKHAINAAIQAAPFDVNVLIYGENGTGKEVFHKILHNCSPRRYNKCIPVNCGGLPEGTIDSELFGHIKGAFTGALNDRKGYFEEANGGTIFLDEIGELPMATQAKLLRVIETGEYYRMGSNEVRKTDVRIVAATNVDLQKSIRQGTFREDLYYRLSTITINVPSLRERQEDIFLLFRKFAGDIADKYKMPAIQLDDRAKMKLAAYRWPGNVRQLLHTIEHISIVESERLITAETLQRYLPNFDSGMSLRDESSTQGGGFAPGEKEMLYKLVFTMKNQLEEIRMKMGMANEPANDPSYTGLALPAAQEEIIDTDSEEVTMDERYAGTPRKEIAVKTEDYIPEIDSNGERVVSLDRHQKLDDLEREAIKYALETNGGNKRKAAEKLGISERTMFRKVEEYGLLDMLENKKNK